jgi:drug/metabolite transporter (DMT)-like permease
MWLLFALLTPLFFAVVHVVDAYCVEDVFDQPWMGFVTSALASAVLCIPLSALLLLSEWQTPSLEITLMALGAGCLIQLSQLLYFQALKYTEAGIVAAYWNMVPMLVVLLSFLLLHERLDTNEYAGIALLIVASIAFCALDTNLEMRGRSFALMAAAAALQAAMFLMEDVVFAGTSYASGFLLITLGLVLTGLAPMLLRSPRRAFVANLPRLTPAVGILIGIEVINLLALASSQRAVDLGTPSLVAAVETTIPAYTFMLSIAMLSLLPMFGDTDSRKHLPKKLGLVGLMSAGVFMLA